jgi:hypothetical protein
MGTDDRLARINWPEGEGDHLYPFNAVDFCFAPAVLIHGSVFGIMASLQVHGWIIQGYLQVCEHFENLQ